MYVTREFRFQGERLLVRSTVLLCDSTGTGCDIARDAASRPLKELQGEKSVSRPRFAATLSLCLYSNTCLELHQPVFVLEFLSLHRPLSIPATDFRTSR